MWLSLLPIIAQLIPVFDKNSAQAQQLAAITAEVGQAIAAVGNGWQPPRSLDAVAADLKLIAGQVTPDMLAAFPALATIETSLTGVANWLTDLQNGDLVVVGKFNAPLPGSPLAYDAVFLAGGKVAAQFGL